MITKTTRIKLIVFVIVAVLGVGYGSWRYAGGDRLVGNRTYTVPMVLGDTSGIFTNAEVTYRGVAVGRVGDIELTDTGLVVNLQVEYNAPSIPKNVTATVANRSAVGEQYVDLKPRSSSGPYLADVPEKQRTIAEADTTTPLPPQTLLNDTNKLAKSVPLNSLRTVVDELDTSFDGTGGDLQRILDTTRSFTRGARQNLPAFRQLLTSSRTVLSTQAQEAGNLRQFSSDLRNVSQTLKGSDADVRRLIQDTPGAANQINGVVNDNGQNISKLLANTLTLTDLANPRLNGLEQIFVTYPPLAAGTNTVVGGNGDTAHLGLALNLFNPPPCVAGYEGTDKRAATGDDPATGRSNTEPRTPNRNAYCAAPTGSPIDVRGSQNAPYKGQPVDVPPGAGESSADGQEQSQQAPSSQVQAQQSPPDSVAGTLGLQPLASVPDDLNELLNLK